jgi:hypothetical protein
VLLEHIALVNASSGAVIGRPVSRYVANPTLSFGDRSESAPESEVVGDAAIAVGVPLQLRVTSTVAGGVTSTAVSPVFVVDNTPPTGATVVVTPMDAESRSHTRYWNVAATDAAVCWPGLREDAYAHVVSIVVTVFLVEDGSQVRWLSSRARVCVCVCVCVCARLYPCFPLSRGGLMYGC